MSLVVNTNVSSLTAQRALAYADSLQGEAMQRLSTGSKINSASDDAAGLAIAQRMTAQVNGLNMAVKNANDGIALTQSIEGALVEVSDMLQRLRELSVQAANDTNTGTDRKAIQEEVDLLVAEITRVSANTRYNNELVLDGSFTDRQLQVGTLGGEAISVSVDSVAANRLGSYTVTGDINQAALGAGAGILANSTEAADDFIINGRSVSKTIDVALKDSAKNVAAKVNNVSGETGVTAEAKSFGLLASESDVDVTVSLKINGKSTGEFVISRGNVSDAVDKVNLISGSTGVTAIATSDNKVRMYAADGSDMLVENTSSDTSLRVQTLGHDGKAELPQRYWNRATGQASAAGANQAVHTARYAPFDVALEAAATTDTIDIAFAGTTLSFGIEASGTTVGKISQTADIDTVLTDIQAHGSYATGNFVASKDSSGNLVLTAKTSAAGDQNTLATYKVGSATAVNFDQTTAGNAAAGSDYTDRGAADGAYTLVRRSDGQTFSFNVTASSGTSGDVSAADIKTALNGIEGVSGFEVKAKNDSIDSTMIVTATTDFGDFDIYKGGDVELDTARQTFDGIGGVVEWSGAKKVTNPGNYILNNKTTGEQHTFSIADSDSASDIDASELQTALNGIVGVSGFTVHNKPGAAGTAEADSFAFGHSSATDTTALSSNTAWVKQADTFTYAALDTVIEALATTAGTTLDFTFAGTTLSFGTETSGSTAGKISKTADIDTVLADIQAHSNYGTANFVASKDGSGDLVLTAKTSGAISTRATYTATGASAVSASQTTAGVTGDSIVVNAGGVDTTLKVVTNVSGQAGTGEIGKDATAAQLASALDATKGTASGSFSANTATFKVDFTHDTNGQKTDSTGATLGGVAVTTTTVDGKADGETLVIHGNADFGDFDILSSAGAALSGTSGTITAIQAGDINLLDVALTAGNTTTDSATIQGTISLSSSQLFSVTQRDEESTTNSLTAVSDTAPSNSRDATGSLGNDNYFTTQTAQLETVSAIDLRTQSGASDALSIIDGAIEKVSSMRSSLGAVENRLDHTVNNLMNISEKTESARSRIQDADFAAESAKLSKAQVLKQAGVGMLAQANASGQLVLQLLQ